MPENLKAWYLWTLVNSQWRAGGFSIIGLDFPAVFQIAGLYGIEINPGMFQKLRALEVEELKRVDKNEQRSTNNNLGQGRRI